MLYLKDRGEVWSVGSMDGKRVLFDDGTEKDLETSDLMVTIGKYKGMDLSDVSDRGYLEWMYNASMEKDEVCTANRIKMRLDELSE
jgi:hypothetical protein